VLIVAARTGDDPRYLEIIDEMDRELTKVIEGFDCIVNVGEMSRLSTLPIRPVSSHFPDL